MSVRVVTDSACDLPTPLAAELGIDVVPLTIRFGAEELVDGVELSNQAFWQRLPGAATLPETAAPSAGAFGARFRALAESGADGIICVNLSSRLSATMQAAQVAAQSFDGGCPIEVVDSLTCSMGLGNLCLAAARRANEGAPLDEIVLEVTDRRDRTRLFGTLDTLEFLKKGGRVGNARALLGSMLAVKPVVEIRGGVVEEAGKVRTRSKALRLLADKVHEQPVEEVAVLQGDAPDIDDFLDLIEDVAPRDKIVVGSVGPVIGTHAGPGVLGVTFQLSG